MSDAERLAKIKKVVERQRLILPVRTHNQIECADVDWLIEQVHRFHGLTEDMKRMLRQWLKIQI